MIFKSYGQKPLQRIVITTHPVRWYMRTENVIPDFAKYDGGENFTYKNIIYTKKECLGKGAYGEVFRFEANTPS